jgi:ABC-type glycerol-3-phosphate transport system permease component
MLRFSPSPTAVITARRRGEARCGVDPTTLGQPHPMAAMAVLVAVPAAVVFYLVQKHLVSGLTAGGTKG